MGTSRRQGQVFRSRKCLIVSRSRAPTQNVRRRRGVNRSSSSPVHNCYSYHRPGRRKQQVQLLIQFLLAFLTILNVFFFEIQKENSKSFRRLLGRAGGCAYDCRQPDYTHAHQSAEKVGPTGLLHRWSSNDRDRPSNLRSKNSPRTLKKENLSSLVIVQFSSSPSLFEIATASTTWSEARKCKEDRRA